MENWLKEHWQITGGTIVTIAVAWYFAQRNATASVTDPNQAALAQQVADENAASQASALSTLFGGGASGGNPNTTQVAATAASSLPPTVILLPIGPAQGGTPSGGNPGAGNPSGSTTVTLPTGLQVPATLPYGTPQNLAGGIFQIATSPSALDPSQTYHPASGVTVTPKAPTINPTTTAPGNPVSGGRRPATPPAPVY